MIYNISETVQERHSGSGRLIGNRMCLIEWHHYRLPLVTFDLCFFEVLHEAVSVVFLTIYACRLHHRRILESVL